MIVEPNIVAEWTKKSSDFTATGKPIMGKPKTIKIASIRYREGLKTSSVNQNSSASEGQGQERTVVARILVPPQHRVERGDKIVFGGKALRVSYVWPHYDIVGHLDHFEVDGVAWLD